MTKEQRHCGVDRRHQENIPSSCTLPSNQFQCQLRHFSYPIREVGNDQPRLPAFHIFKLLLPGRPGFLKSYQGCHHKAVWPVLQLTTLPKTQGRPSRKARSLPKVAGFDSSLHHTPGVSSIAEPSLPKIGGHRSPTIFCPDAMGCSRGSLSFNSASLASTSCSGHPPHACHVRDRIRRVVLPRGSPNCQNCLQRL